MALQLPAGMQITGNIKPEYESILTPDALALVAKLHRAFEGRRQELLKARVERQARIDAGEMPDFLPETKAIREGDWKIAPLPKALERRRTEITGPVEAKMIINAFNSGADSYMTDFEDSNSPNWDNQMQGQVNLYKAIRRELSFKNEAGKEYKLNDKIATLQIRPRGWHLDEKHVTVDGQRVSGGIFDFALVFFHNAKEQIARGAGPFYYLPKMESHLEARLWNDIFVMAQDHIGLPQGTIKATVLVETILATFEMEEILYELRNHSRRPERRPLGLHLLLHQEVQEEQGLLPGPAQRHHHGSALHAFLRAGAGQGLPQARRAGHGRHVGPDPDQERSGRQREGAGRHPPRQDAATPTTASTAAGWRTRAWFRSLRKNSRKCWATVRTSGKNSATKNFGRQGFPQLPAGTADHRSRPAQQHQRRHPLPRRLAGRQWLRAHP